MLLAASIEREEQQTVLVVCPLKTITEDQIAEAKSIVISAASATDISEDDLRAAKFQLIFGWAETVIERRFLDILKDNCSSLHRKLAAIVVDTVGLKKVILFLIDSNWGTFKGKTVTYLRFSCHRSEVIDFHESPYCTFKDSLQHLQ